MDARPLGSAPLEKAMASGCLGVGSLKASASGHVSVARVGKAGRLPVGKNCHPRRDAKNANADRIVALHGQIYFTAWVACAREIDGPNVFGCDRSGRGIDFLAASGFNDVSTTGILTYPRKLGGAQV